jgi:Ran GTPase-activating protein (RanGAP) involved in mRNA processing and transport
MCVQVNRGAELAWLSQYPRESEVLLPPLSNLEVVGESYVEEVTMPTTPPQPEHSTLLPAAKSQGQIIIVPIRLDINNKSRTIEDLIATRKRLHLATYAHLLEESKRELRAMLVGEGAEQLLQEAMVPLQKNYELEQGRAVEWFNDDHHFREAHNQMLDTKEATLAKVQVLVRAQRKLEGRGVQFWSHRETQLLFQISSLRAAASDRHGSEAGSVEGGSGASFEQDTYNAVTAELQLCQQYLSECVQGQAIAVRETLALTEVQCVLSEKVQTLRETLQVQGPVVPLLLQEDDRAITLFCAHLLGSSMAGGEHQQHSLTAWGYGTGRSDLLRRNYDTQHTEEWSRRLHNTVESFTGRMLADNSALSPPPHFFKLSTQQNPFDDILAFSAAQYPDIIPPLLELLDDVGWFGENNAEDERRCRQLKNWLGQCVEKILGGGVVDLDCTPDRCRTVQGIVDASVVDQHHTCSSCQTMPRLLGGYAPENYNCHTQRCGQELLDMLATYVQWKSGGTRTCTPKDSTGETDKAFLLHAVAVEARWMCQVYAHLRAHHTFCTLRTMEKRLHWGRGGLGNGHTPTVYNAIIHPIEHMPPSQFVDSTFVRRLNGAVDLLAQLLSNTSIPWLCSFDEHVLCLDPFAVDQMFHSSDMGAGKYSGLGTCMGYSHDRSIDEVIYGSPRSGIRSTYCHSAYLDESPWDGDRYIKEHCYRQYASMGPDAFQMRMTEVSLARPFTLERFSIERIFEIVAIGFGVCVPSLDEIKYLATGNPRLGWGGSGAWPSLQLDTSLVDRQWTRAGGDRLYMLLMQEMCWIGALFPYTSKIDQWLLAPLLADTHSATERMFVTELTKKQLCFIAGVVSGCRSTVKLYSSQPETPPLDFNTRAHIRRHATYTELVQHNGPIDFTTYKPSLDYGSQESRGVCIDTEFDQAQLTILAGCILFSFAQLGRVLPGFGQPVNSVSCGNHHPSSGDITCLTLYHKYTCSRSWLENIWMLIYMCPNLTHFAMTCNSKDMDICPVLDMLKQLCPQLSALIVLPAPGDDAESTIHQLLASTAPTNDTVSSALRLDNFAELLNRMGHVKSVEYIGFKESVFGEYDWSQCRIEELSLYNMSVAPPLVRESCVLPTIRTLHCTSCRMDDTAVNNLSLALMTGHQLQTLSLRDNAITCNGSSMLSLALQSCSQLVSLDLSGNNISDRGCAALGEGVSCCSSLCSLNLSNNNIGNTGIQDLMRLIGNSPRSDAIHTLRLASNSFRSAGALAIARVLPSLMLTCLDVSSNAIGIYGMYYLLAALAESEAVSELLIDNIPDTRWKYVQRRRQNAVQDGSNGNSEDEWESFSGSELDEDEGSCSGDCDSGSTDDSTVHSSDIGVKIPANELLQFVATNAVEEKNDANAVDENYDSCEDDESIVFDFAECRQLFNETESMPCILEASCTEDEWHYLSCSKEEVHFCLYQVLKLLQNVTCVKVLHADGWSLANYGTRDALFAPCLTEVHMKEESYSNKPVRLNPPPGCPLVCLHLSPMLHTVEVSNISLGNASGQLLLEALLHCPALKYLNISRTRLTSCMACVSTLLSTARHLESLILSLNYFGDDQVADLVGGLSKASVLKVIELQYHKFTAAKVVLLISKGLMSCTSLESVRLSLNNQTPEEISAIVTLIHLHEKLRYLQVDTVRNTPEGTILSNAAGTSSKHFTLKLNDNHRTAVWH